ncbi:hypothetical protein O3M35_010096 [Rhynocoris fuscipes]|uniref:Outer dense fiber protein 3 n=1 Tax=Rhynocoris fuscipes TaxID=488301 RepID=A0AAW1D0V1_9HEMI
MESRSAFILGKQKYTYQITPGPGRYAPEQHPDPRYKTAPSSTLGIRPAKIIGTKTPGATKYNVPTTIGPQVIDKRASPAYTMLGRNIKFTEGNRSPGPGRYGVSPIDCYKKRSRSANILGPYQFIQTKKGIPGPKYSWTINEKREPPAYSFGVRHSLKKIIYYHPADLGESAL